MSKDAPLQAQQLDIVNHPPHYEGVSGIECIDAIEAMGCGPEFCRANAVKYLWRLGKKGQALEDAKKCLWYVTRLVKQLEESNDSPDRLVTQLSQNGIAHGKT